MDPKVSFRNSMGKLYTRGLFLEEVRDDPSSVVYTLKDTDHKGFPSLYRLYMETADPTEYKFAVSYLEGWDHWQELSSADWFQPYVTRWRQELSVKIRSELISNILSVARDKAHNSSFQANRYLLEASETSKRGRPSKDEVRAEVKRQALLDKDFKDDAARILSTIN